MTITLSESESRRIMVSHGVPVSAYVTGTTTNDVIAAVEAAADVDYPVVAKLCGRAIAHKTERGLVRLHLNHQADLAAACDDLLAAARPDDGEVEVLVSAMVSGNRELIAGLNDDPQFGMTIMVGVGGILAEAIRDVAFRLVPINEADAREMIDDLSTQSLLGSFRGEPAVDRQALVGALLALSAVAVGDASVRSADLNPLIIVDGKPVAVDALIEIDEQVGLTAERTP